MHRVFFSEAFRGPATVFADKALAAPAIAVFSVYLPVKASKTVRDAEFSHITLFLPMYTSNFECVYSMFL